MTKSSHKQNNHEVHGVIQPPRRGYLQATQM